MKYLIIAISLIISAWTANSAETNFYATANPTTVSEGSNIQVTFTLENAQGSGFRAPGFRGFTVLMGPSTSQSTQIINGRMSSSVSYTYVLKADAKGTFTISPATVVVNGNRIQSNSLKVNVVEPSEAEKTQRQQARQQEKDLNSQAIDFLRKRLFLRLNVSKTNVYQGEQIVAEYKLFINQDILNRLSQVTSPKAPVLSGFFSQEVDVQQQNYRTEVIDGQPYKTLIVKKVILMPQKSGKLIIDPMSIDYTARLQVQGASRRRRSNDPFDQFFDDPFFNNGNYRDFSYTAKSNSVDVNVKPLPENPPLSFNGAVGELDMVASMGSNKTKTNEPVDLKIKISGSGNLKLIDAPDLNLPPDIESFEPKTKDNVSVTTSGISGSKTFEYLLIPRHPGDYTIDPVEFTYFDLEKKQYVTLTSKPFSLHVEKGEGTYANEAAGKEEVEYVDQDIRFLKSYPGSLEKEGDDFYASSGFYILTFTPPLLFAFFFIFIKKKRELEANRDLLRTKRATKIARERMNSAKTHMNNAEKDKFYDEVDKALWGYLGDKLLIPQAELTKEKASGMLSARDIEQESIGKYLSLIESCEFARYAPPSDTEAQMERIYSDSVKVISELEEKLK